MLRKIVLISGLLSLAGCLDLGGGGGGGGSSPSPGTGGSGSVTTPPAQPGTPPDETAPPRYRSRRR